MCYGDLPFFLARNFSRHRAGEMTRTASRARGEGRERERESERSFSFSFAKNGNEKP